MWGWREKSTPGLVACGCLPSKNKKERYKLSQMKALMLAVEIAADGKILLKEACGMWD